MSERRLPLPQLSLALTQNSGATVDDNGAIAQVVPEVSPKVISLESSLVTTPPQHLSKPKSKSKTLATLLQAEFAEEVRLVWTDNRSLLLSTSRTRGKLNARVHQMFLGGDISLLSAIARFLKDGDKGAGEKIDDFVEQSRHLLQLHAAPLKRNAGKGRVHNLDEIFDDVNRAYFGGSFDVEITWGQAGAFAGKRRRSIVLGSYDSRAHRITMHPALDQDRVPKICVARVVHHEVLHIKYPTVVGKSGRRIVHGRAFRKEEATFVSAKSADEWIDTNLASILGYRPADTKR